MRFKIDDNKINFFLSGREQQRYGLLESNVLDDNGLAFKIEAGEHEITINNKPIRFNVKMLKADIGFRLEVTSGGAVFQVDKLEEINKYDCYRAIARHYRSIQKDG